MAGWSGWGDFQLTGFQARLCALLLVHCGQPSRLDKSHNPSVALLFQSYFVNVLRYGNQPLVFPPCSKSCCYDFIKLL